MNVSYLMVSAQLHIEFAGSTLAIQSLSVMHAHTMSNSMRRLQVQIFLQNF